MRPGLVCVGPGLFCVWVISDYWSMWKVGGVMDEARFDEEFPVESEGQFDGPIRLVVPGKPQQWARAGGGKTGHRFTPAHVTRQMDLMRLVWEREGSRRLPDETPIELHAGFFYERPKSHYGTGRNAGVLKAGFEFREPIGRPDFDNLLKLIGDTFSGFAFDDDSRVTLGSWIKAYVPRGVAPFTVFTLESSTSQWRRLVLGKLGVDLDEGQV